MKGFRLVNFNVEVQEIENQGALIRKLKYLALIASLVVGTAQADISGFIDNHNATNFLAATTGLLATCPAYQKCIDNCNFSSGIARFSCIYSCNNTKC